jgi:hypothetical protein
MLSVRVRSSCRPTPSAKSHVTFCSSVVAVVAETVAVAAVQGASCLWKVCSLRSGRTQLQ